MRKMLESLRKIKIKDYIPFLIYFSLITIASIAVDQVSKYVAEANLPLGEVKPLIPNFIDFYLTYNKGAAWGLGDNNVFSRVLLVIISWVVGLFMPGYVIYKMAKNEKFEVIFGVCLALIWGGDIGNLIDRTFFFDRGVIDFISIQSWWPGFGIFNIADSALVVGILMLFVYMLVKEIQHFLKQKRENEEKLKNEEQEEKNEQ
ncbi:MAG: signal peptidase II [Bacilli bacterium]|nr:signal peptidase II [Bacilli bacterium]